MDISGLIYNEFNDSTKTIREEYQQPKYTNVLLIDCCVPAYKSFVDSVNSDTLPIVYSTDGSSKTLIQLLRSKCTTISRLGVCFVTPINATPVRFLDNTALFNGVDIPRISGDEIPPKIHAEMMNSNVQFVLNVINEFSIKNIDFLGCNTLNSANWKNYYDLLSQSTGVIIGASDDKTGNLKYGGDWILETTSQDIELVYFTKSIENYSYLLDNTEWILTTNAPFVSPIQPQLLAMVSDGDYIYGSYNNINTSSIFRIHIETKTVESNWVSNDELKTYIWQMVIYNGQLYGTLGSGSVFRINTSNKTDATFNLFVKEPASYMRGIAAYGNKLYITNYSTSNVYVYNLQTSQIETRTFIESTITTYINSLSLSTTSVNIGLGHLFIYNNYLYAATNESTGNVNLVFKWSLSSPTTDNSMNFTAQGMNPVVSNSILPDRIGGWVVVNNQLYFVRNDVKSTISRLNLDDLTDYVYDYYIIDKTNTTIDSGLASDNTYLYFQNDRPNFTQINLIRPTTPNHTVSIDASKTYTVSYGNLQVSIIDTSNALNNVYYQYYITGVNENAYTTANTFSTGESTLTFYITNIFNLTDISYTINVNAKNKLGLSNTVSQMVVLYTLPNDIINCSVVYANGNIKISITENSPTMYYYLNNVSYLYYLYNTGININQSSNALAYTVGANVTSESYTTEFDIPNIPVTTNKYRIYLIAKNNIGNTIANVFSTNVYSIPSATVSFDTENTKSVASGNLKVQLLDSTNISINDVYYYYSVNNDVDSMFTNTFVKANVSPYSFYIPSITDISNTIYVKAVNPIGKSSPSANIQVIVNQVPSQPDIQLELVGSGNVQVTIREKTPPSYYYLNNVSYYLYVYNTFGGTNLSDNTSLLVYNKPSGILSNTNSTYANIVSYVTGLNANTYTMYVIATNPFGSSVPVYANIKVYIHPPQKPTIEIGNTVSSSSGNLTVSIVDNVNLLDNGIYYWYSTDNISYSNSGVAKTTDTNYRFTINNTGDNNVPLVAGTYTLYVRAYNALGYATSNPVTVKVYTTPKPPTIVTDNTYLTKNNKLTISIIDSDNSSTNDIYYWYSTDNISYSNSGVAKSFGTSYQFTISDTGNSLVPLNVNTVYSLYVRAQNPLGNVTTMFHPVNRRDIALSSWLEYANYSNKFNQTYFRNFVDINGECIVRNGSLTVDMDGTFSGNLSGSKNLQLAGSASIQTDLTVNLSTNLNRLTTTGDASFNTNVFVSNNTNLNKLTIAGDSSCNGNMVVLKNTTLNADLTVNKDTTLIGTLYGTDDATFNAKMVVAQDTTLQSSLGVYGITNLYGYRSYPVLNFLRTVNIKAEYTFADRSSTADPISSESRIVNPFVLNAITNTIDASFESTNQVNISSAGIYYYYVEDNTRVFNNGGLLTYPYPLRNITNVTVHILVNFSQRNDTSKIIWNFLEILTQTDASYSSLYTFKLISNNGINKNGSNNEFTISNNNSNSINLTNSAFKSDIDMWMSISQNIINGDSTIYLNGNVLCSFTSVVASSALQQSIVYSIGYSRSVSIFDQSYRYGEKTIKRIIIDYNGKYTNESMPNIIGVFNTNKTLYVPPVLNVTNDSIIVNGNVAIQDKLNVTGNTTLNSKFDVFGDVSFGSNLYVAKTTNMNQQLNVVGDVSFGSKLYVANDATLTKKLTVMEDASFNKNIGANTISIIGDVSFVSPTGTLYANNIKLKRTSGITGTTTNIESNTISTGLINVDSINVANGIFPEYINSNGEITAPIFTSPTQNSLQNPTKINGGEITADSISVDGTKPISKTIICHNLQVNGGLITRGTIQGSIIKADTSLTSSESIISTKEMKAASFATSGAILPANTEGSVYVEKLVRAGHFAVKGQPEVDGEINGVNLNASETITANVNITAGSFKTKDGSFIVSSAGALTATTFKTPNGSFIVSSDGNLTASSLSVNGAITFSGETNFSSIKANLISSNGLITASSFITTGTTDTADAGGISVTSVKASGNIKTTGVITASSFQTSGQVSCTTINATSTITALSFKTPDTIPADAGGISVTTVKASNAVTALSFNATSDKRLKHNIHDMPSQWENIKALKPSEYNWIENSKYDCGFIAQQIYTVYPHLRQTWENVIINDEDCPVSLDGKPVYYTIDYGKMTPYLCKGLQEVMSETEQLKMEIAKLKAQIQSLLEKK